MRGRAPEKPLRPGPDGVLLPLDNALGCWTAPPRYHQRSRTIGSPIAFEESGRLERAPPKIMSTNLSTKFC